MSEALTECPKCGGPEYRRVLFPPTVFDSTPRTLGALAERNTTRERGRMQDEKADESPSYTPWWRSGPPDKSLLEMSPAAQQNYIMTGKKSEPLTPSISSE